MCSSEPPPSVSCKYLIRSNSQLGRCLLHQSHQGRKWDAQPRDVASAFLCNLTLKLRSGLGVGVRVGTGSFLSSRLCDGSWECGPMPWSPNVQSRGPGVWVQNRGPIRRREWVPWLFRRELTLRDSSLAQAVQRAFCIVGCPAPAFPFPRLAGCCCCSPAPSPTRHMANNIQLIQDNLVHYKPLDW